MTVSRQLRTAVSRVGYLPLKWSPGGQRRRHNLDKRWPKMTRIVRARGRDVCRVDFGLFGRGSAWDRTSNEQREDAGMLLELPATGPVHTPLFAPRGQGVCADPPHCGVSLIALDVLRTYALFDCDVLGKSGVGGSIVGRCRLPVSLVC